jgi:TRAP-type C4-dicarboxylate transport system permease small subunit
MSSKTARVTSWVVAVLLLLASGWSFNIATYNWFAADFHNQYSHAYVSRGNIFSIIAFVLFATAMSMIVALIWSAKKRRVAKA